MRLGQPLKGTGKTSTIRSRCRREGQLLREIKESLMHLPTEVLLEIQTALSNPKPPNENEKERNN